MSIWTLFHVPFGQESLCTHNYIYVTIHTIEGQCNSQSHRVRRPQNHKDDEYGISYNSAKKPVLSRVTQWLKLQTNKYNLHDCCFLKHLYDNYMNHDVSEKRGQGYQHFSWESERKREDRRLYTMILHIKIHYYATNFSALSKKKQYVTKLK